MSKKHRNHNNMQSNTTDLDDIIIKDSEVDDLVSTLKEEESSEQIAKDDTSEKAETENSAEKQASINEQETCKNESDADEVEPEDEEKTNDTSVMAERGTSKESEYLELAQRIKAEFDNYKRRNSDLAKNSFDNGVVHTVEKFLPVVDSFKQAKASITDENTLKGLDLILSQIHKAFEDLGVTKIKAEGEKFDPNYHNAVLVGKDEEKEDGVILQELQEGFIYKGEKVIRHSVVQINKLD